MINFSSNISQVIYYMDSLETRLLKIKDVMAQEGIEIIYTITTDNKPLLIIPKGMIIIGNTKNTIDEDGNITHHWERVYPDFRSIIHRNLGGTIKFHPPVLPHI